MYFRKATTSDCPEIKLLWKTVFLDSEDYIYRFISHFGIENCYVCETDDTVVAMAFALSTTLKSQIVNQKSKIVNLKSKTINLPLYYLYACATHPHYRQQGIMKKLLETIYNKACGDGIAGIFLRAATPVLENYYRKLGFADFFYGGFINHNKHKRDSKNFISPETYHKKRIQKLENVCFVNWDEGFFKFLHDTGTLFCEEEHEIFAFRIVNDTILIDEVLDDNLEELPNNTSYCGQIKWCNFQKPATLNNGYFAFAME